MTEKITWVQSIFRTDLREWIVTSVFETPELFEQYVAPHKFRKSELHEMIIYTFPDSEAFRNVRLKKVRCYEN